MQLLKKFFNENKVVLISIFAFTILCFGYYGVSTIVNNDGVLDFIIDSTTNAGYKLYLSVGRWGWALIGMIFNYYPLPFLYLIINAIFFSLSTVYISRIFDIKKDYQKIIVGALLVSNPINAYAYAYSNWQASIGIAFFLAIYGVYLLKNAKGWSSYLISILIFTFTISIYQMFLPFLAILFSFISIQALIENKNLNLFIKTVLKYLLIFVLSCILYYLTVEFTTFVFKIDLSYYQGANKMFDFSFIDFIRKFKTNFISCFTFNDLYFFPKFSHIILIILVIINFIVLIRSVKDTKKLMMFVLLLILMIAPQIIRFVKYDQWFHEVTLIPYVIFYAGNVALLYKNLNNKKLEKIVTTLLIIVLFSFAISINKAGVMAKNASNAAYYFANRLQMRIESTDGYNLLSNPKKYYFIGGYDLYDFPYSDRAYSPSTGITTNFVFNPLNMVDAINVMGIDAIYYNNLADLDTKYEINKRAKDIKAYPDSSSIFIYEDIIVIKMK